MFLLSVTWPTRRKWKFRLRGWGEKTWKANTRLLVDSIWQIVRSRDNEDYSVNSWKEIKMILQLSVKQRETLDNMKHMLLVRFISKRAELTRSYVGRTMNLEKRVWTPKCWLWCEHHRMIRFVVVLNCIPFNDKTLSHRTRKDKHFICAIGFIYFKTAHKSSSENS